MTLAKVLDGICTDYGFMPHEILGMDLAEVSFALEVRRKARAK